MVATYKNGHKVDDTHGTPELVSAMGAILARYDRQMAEARAQMQNAKGSIQRQRWEKEYDWLHIRKSHASSVMQELWKELGYDDGFVLMLRTYHAANEANENANE